jgi:hypothetical protein
MRFYLKAREGVWYICWTERGDPRRVSTGERDRQRAELVLARHVLTSAERVEQTLLRDVISRYYLMHARALASKDQVRYTLACVEKHLPGLRVDELTPDTQARFRDALVTGGMGPSTIRRRVGVIRSALAWSVSSIPNGLWPTRPHGAIIAQCLRKTAVGQRSSRRRAGITTPRPCMTWPRQATDGLPKSAT